MLLKESAEVDATDARGWTALMKSLFNYEQNRGFPDVLETLIEANAIVTNANCGACPGLHGGILGPGEVAITSITRNFEGRMGPGGEIYLASPATVAASAIEGCITSPLHYL